MGETSRLRTVTITLGAIIVAVAAMQFLRIDKSNPPVTGDLQAPAEIASALRRACYDCHSNETRWPWYADVAPASFLVGHDVSEARSEMNFSTWTRYEGPRRAKMMRETAEEVEEKQMPPWYYVLMHPEARLSADDRKLIIDWTLAERTKLPPEPPRKHR